MIYTCEVEFTTSVTLSVEADSYDEASERAITLARDEGISAPHVNYDYRVLSVQE